MTAVCTVPVPLTSLLRVLLLLLRDPILKVCMHASLGQLCYINEVNRRPTDGRVSELAPLAVPQQYGAVLKFLLYTVYRRVGEQALCRSSGDF